MHNLKAQSGHSMVEILAVIAVIGILSVAGVEGYTYAMKKNEANNVAEEVSILAHEVSQQMMRSHTPEDVTDLVQDVKDVEIKVAKYTPAQKKYADGKPNPEKDDRFALEVKGLKPEVAKILLSSGLASEPGLQKIQQNDGETIQDITGTQGLDETSGSITLGLVFSKDLSDTCPAGEYKVDGLCQEATGNNISSGDGVLQECGQATKPNSEHTECINCSAEENCGCEDNKISSGKGHCVYCVKNANCGENKWCDTKGDCFACPDNGTCAGDKTGFTCNPGYKADDKGGCEAIPTNNCPTGTTVVSGYEGNDALGDGKCECTSWTTNQCGTGYYCQFTPSECTDSYTKIAPPNAGVCKDITPCGMRDVTGTNFRYSHLSGDCRPDWWTANAICAADGGRHLVSLQEIGCGDAFKRCISDILTSIRSGGIPYAFWTTDMYTKGDDDSCFATVVNRSGYFIRANRYYVQFVALCQ